MALKKQIKRQIILLALVALPAFPNASPASEPVKVILKVTDKGFEPNSVDVAGGSNLILEITRISDLTCATSIEIPAKKIKKDLPLNKTVQVKVGKLEKGEIRFGCGMNMMEGGKIYVK